MQIRFDASAVPLVETRALGKRYGTTVALDDIWLNISVGKSMALVGRNGAGKSTLVRLLTGLDRPDSGEIRFAGEPGPDLSARAAWRSKVACVYQKSTIIADLTVGENLFLNDQPSSTIGLIRWDQIRRLGRQELELWGLEADIDQRAGDLSIGQRQLLEVARSLRQGARFIILDEPTARLEAREIEHLFEHIKQLKSVGVTFLFISHYLEEIYEICDRVAVLRDGRLVMEAAIGETTEAELVAAMVGKSHSSIGPASHGAISAELDGLVDRPIVLEVDSVSVQGMVDRVSLAVRERERVGLAGLAGSGKSELAEVIVGRRKPTEGRILVHGKALLAARVDFARGIGIAFVPEDRHANGFCSNLSVEENISLPILRRLSRWGFIMWRRRRELVSSMIERLQIKVSDPAQNAAELSGGNQQKTVMARALASNPDVLVLGSPTAGVDIAAKQALFGIIRALDSAILVVSDEIDDLAICHRVVVMRGGKIAREFQGPWQENEMVAAMEGVGR
jgi:simple sugar transport system ATP-binding protein